MALLWLTDADAALERSPWAPALEAELDCEADELEEGKLLELGLLELELELEAEGMLLDELWLWLDDEEGIDGELLEELWLLDWQANRLKLTPPSRISLGNMLNVCFISILALDLPLPEFSGS